MAPAGGEPLQLIAHVRAGAIGGGSDQGKVAERISVAAFATLSLAYSFTQVDVLAMLRLQHRVIA